MMAAWFWIDTLFGIVAGAVFAFIALAVPFKQRYDTLLYRWMEERGRRIDAEMNQQVVNIQPWDGYTPTTQLYQGPLIDLTDIDDLEEYTS